MPISDFILPEFDQEMANTRKVLERVPDDRWDWKPHQKSWNMSSLATHVAFIPSWDVDTIGKDSLDIAPPGAPPYKAPVASSRKELLELFDKHVSAARAALAGASDDHLLKPWSLLAGGKTLFTMPRAAVIRSMVMNHGIHHRAQLCVYLRLADIPMPGMYGPSADEQGVFG